MEVAILGESVLTPCIPWVINFSHVGVFVLITEIGSSDLLCGHVSLQLSITVTTTPLCLISGMQKKQYNVVPSMHKEVLIESPGMSLWHYYAGAVFHYTIVSMTLFWFFHVCVFFYNVMFPFYANAKRSREKYMHIVMAVIG